MTLTGKRIAERCQADGEFRLAARYWDGSLVFDLSDKRLDFIIAGGRIAVADAKAPDISLSAPVDLWAKILAPVPRPHFNDIMPARAFGLRVEGNEEMFSQYYPAIRRMVDLMREDGLD